GSRPGVFFANMRNPAETPKFAMRTLAYHEGIPGHHFQISVQQELKGVPFFRRVLPFTAFSEGWALYAERLAWELGFEKDPLDNLGRLRDEMMRAVRLVVDTGIHHEHWTREQAIAYMINQTGMDEGDVTSEIERYFVAPGQALAYKAGMLKILELRERARSALGPRFKLSEFHDQVLTHGALPLSLLERGIDDWIAQRKARPLARRSPPRLDVGRRLMTDAKNDALLPDAAFAVPFEQVGATPRVVGARHRLDGLGKAVGAWTSKGEGAEAFSKLQILELPGAPRLHHADQSILKRRDRLPLPGSSYLVIGELQADQDLLSRWVE